MLSYEHGSEALLKNRIAASIALAAGLALGASGCSLIAHNGTAVHYAPSDGVQITTSGVALRNIVLVAAKDGENFNVVFTGVNTTGAPVTVKIDFEAGKSKASVKFDLPEGSTSFGDLSEDQPVVVATLPGLKAGASAKAYFTIDGEGGHEEYLPVLDGTLLEYSSFVLYPGQTASTAK